RCLTRYSQSAGDHGTPNSNTSSDGTSDNPQTLSCEHSPQRLTAENAWRAQSATALSAKIESAPAFAIVLQSGLKLDFSPASVTRRRTTPCRYRANLDLGSARPMHLVR